MINWNNAWVATRIIFGVSIIALGLGCQFEESDTKKKTEVGTEFGRVVLRWDGVELSSNGDSSSSAIEPFGNSSAFHSISEQTVPVPVLDKVSVEIEIKREKKFRTPISIVARAEFENDAPSEVFLRTENIGSYVDYDD